MSVVRLVAFIVLATNAPAAIAANVDRPHASLRCSHDLLAHGEGLQFEAGARWPDREGLLLRGEPVHDGRTRRHPPSDGRRHFSAAGQTSDAIPVERLVGEAVVVDVTSRAAGNAVDEVTIDDLHGLGDGPRPPTRRRDPASANGLGANWADRAADPWYVPRSGNGGGASQLRFPGLAPDAAKWLVEHRRIKAAGVDTERASIPAPRLLRPRMWLSAAATCRLFENVADLERLPAQGRSSPRCR